MISDESAMLSHLRVENKTLLYVPFVHQELVREVSNGQQKLTTPKVLNSVSNESRTM